MNIFYLDKNPSHAAQMLADRHVVKMILESAQMLATAHRVLDGTLVKRDFAYADGTLRKKNWYKLDRFTDHLIYGATHINHPSSVWVRQSDQHYNWLVYHMIGLCQEYTHRYGKMHKTQTLLPYLKNLPSNIPQAGFTDPPCCMDANYIISEDAVENYQNYYKHGKRHLHSWTNRPPPAWIK